MSYSIQTTKFFKTVPKSVLVVLASVFILGLFVIGFDQGHIFSIVNGESAFVDQFLHELTHDLSLIHI